MLFAEMLAIQPTPQLYQIISGEETMDLIARQEAAILDIRGRLTPRTVKSAAVQNSVGPIRPRPAGGRRGPAGGMSVDYAGRSIVSGGNGDHVVRLPAACRPGQLGKAVEQLQAACGAERRRLEERGAPDAELEKLEEFHAQAQQALVDLFSESAGSFFDQYGQGGLARKMDSSVRTLFLPEASRQGCCTLEEMEFAAAGVSAYRAAANGVCYGSEVWQAIRLAMADMKVERMALHTGGSPVTDAFQAAREEIHRDFLEKMEAHITKRREEGEESPPLDREMFRTAYDAIMREFRVSGNALTAVRVAAEMAPELLGRAAEQTPALRWTRELGADGLWDAFDRPVYLCGMFASLEEDWQEFTSRFISRRELHGQG